MPYAERTAVPVSRSRDVLEQLLRKRGAQGFVSGWDQHADRIEFLWRGLRIRFVLPRTANRSERPEQAERRRWRALLLVVKAKLEAVDAGIALFEEEFLSFIVDPATNQTVGQVLVPQLRDAAGHPRPLLLPELAGTR